MAFKLCALTAMLCSVAAFPNHHEGVPARNYAEKIQRDVNDPTSTFTRAYLLSMQSTLVEAHRVAAVKSMESHFVQEIVGMAAVGRTSWARVLEGSDYPREERDEGRHHHDGPTQFSYYGEGQQRQYPLSEIVDDVVSALRLRFDAGVKVEMVRNKRLPDEIFELRYHSGHSVPRPKQLFDFILVSWAADEGEAEVR